MQIDEAIDLMIAIKNAPEDSPIGAARSLQRCCNKMAELLNVMDKIGYLPVGDGEVSGSVTVDKTGVELSDGWNHIPRIEFNFCPYCGERLSDKPTEGNKCLKT